MTKAILMLFLMAVPAASEKVKAPTLEETRKVVKNLEDTVEEQQERLRLHKLQIDGLQQTVASLESRLSSLEKSTAIRQSANKLNPR
jgi:hypothetical protein